MKKPMDFINGAELLSRCRETGLPISDIMLQREIDKFDTTEEKAELRMQETLSVMKESVRQSTEKELQLLGGYIGGESKKVLERIRQKGAMAGVISKASAYAMGVIELNASMGRIVAAPTAGSSGVLPGMLVAMQEAYDFTDEDLVKALFNAGAIGYIIGRNATLAGAEGGCQAEVGAASAMAASAICELFGGDPETCLAAAGDAISNILGLVCDPVAGLVEYPCQKRNAMGVANAICSAEIALATGGKRLIPFDEVVTTMYNVGRSMPYQLRETALGGLAAAPSARNAKVGGCAACGRCK